MKFTLRIPGRDEIQPALAANSANPLILAGVQCGAAGAAANDDAPAGAEQAPISGLAGLATPATCEADHEAKVERRACPDCQHLLRHGTCAEPVAAGLLTEEQGFGIAWPEPAHAATCPAWVARSTP